MLGSESRQGGVVGAQVGDTQCQCGGRYCSTKEKLPGSVQTFFNFKLENTIEWLQD